MGCHNSTPEHPVRNEGTTAYGGQTVNPGGAHSRPGYPPFNQQHQQPPSMMHHQPPPQMGGGYPYNPQGYGGTVAPQLGGSVMSGGMVGRGVLMFTGLYRYEARTPEDLSFEKGRSVFIYC